MALISVIAWALAVGWLKTAGTDLTATDHTSHPMGLPILWAIIWIGWLVTISIAPVPAILVLTGLKTTRPPGRDRQYRAIVYGALGITMMAWTGWSFGAPLLLGLENSETLRLIYIVFLPHISGLVIGLVAIAVLAWKNS